MQDYVEIREKHLNKELLDYMKHGKKERRKLKRRDKNFKKKRKNFIE